MARLPSPIDLAGNQPTAGRSIPNYGVSPIGAALQGLGQSVMRIGQEGMAQAKETALRDEKFGAQTRFLEFEQNWRKSAADRAENVTPGAAGFTDTLKKDYTTGAQEFFRTIPDDLKSEYDLRLADLEGNLTASADTFASKERDRFALTQIDSGQNVLLDRQNGDPSSWAGVRKEGEDLIANSGLPPITADEQVRAWRKRQGVALFQTDNAADPSGARERIAGPTPENASDAIRRFEGYRSSAYWDVNHYRAGFGSDTVTLADGTVEAVTKDTVVTRADAERDLARRSQEFANTASGQVGAPAWDRLGTGTKAALASVAYNYGSLPESVVGAVRTGDQETIAAAIEKLPANPSRRKQEAAIVRGSDVGPAPQYADIPYEDRVKLFEASQKDERTAVNGQVQDYTAFLRSGQGIASGDAEAGKFTLPELQRVYGPQDGSVIRDEIDQAAAYGKDVAATAFATPDELKTIVDERQALLSKPDEFRQHAQDMNGLLTVIKERNTALANDPASYVQKAPEVAAAYQTMTAAMNDPTAKNRDAAVASYADATLAKQADLGLLPEDRAILPKAAQQEIVSQFKNQPEGGQNAAQLMQGLEGQWGKYWPHIFGEMAKDLPGPALVVGAMNRPGQERAAEQLAQASVLGTKALEDALPTASVKAINDGLPAILSEFSATLSHAGLAGQRTYGTFQEGVKQLALSYASQGEEPSAALTRAYQDVLGKSYTMVGTYRVPIEHNADAISAGADHILRNINGENWTLPTSLAGLPEDQTRAAYLDSVKAHGFWVTTPDESGLELWDGQQKILTTSGSKVQVPWQDILDLNARPPGGKFGPGYSIGQSGAREGGQSNSPFDAAQKEFPILRDVGLVSKSSPNGSPDMLEFWPPGETGGEDQPRPKDIPLDRPGVEIFSDKTKPLDVLGDVVSHYLVKTDPVLKGYYSKFEQSLNTDQKSHLKEQYEWAQKNENETRSYEDWLSASGLPAYFRGYAFKQWPEASFDELYTKPQQAMFDQMMQYLRKKP